MEVALNTALSTQDNPITHQRLLIYHEYLQHPIQVIRESFYSSNKIDNSVSKVEDSNVDTMEVNIVVNEEKTQEQINHCIIEGIKYIQTHSETPLMKKLLEIFDNMNDTIEKWIIAVYLTVGFDNLPEDEESLREIERAIGVKIDDRNPENPLTNDPLHLYNQQLNFLTIKITDWNKFNNISRANGLTVNELMDRFFPLILGTDQLLYLIDLLMKEKVDEVMSICQKLITG